MAETNNLPNHHRRHPKYYHHPFYTFAHLKRRY